MDFYNLVPGDILVTDFNFGLVPYQHWSLVSNKKCKNGFYMLISASERTGTVEEEPIDVVTQGANTYKADLKFLLPVDEVIANAREFIGDWKYSVSKRNCQHFINLVAGLGLTSSQVKAAATLGTLSGIATVLLSDKPSWFKILGFTVAGAAIGVAGSKAVAKGE
jgi:5,10-methenyltetrahydromethanopterin hydrogenase